MHPELTVRADVAPGFDWKRFAPGVVAPAVLFASAQGATIPVLAVAATGLGAGFAGAAAITAAQVIGQLVGNLPTGAVIDRHGERRAMLLAAGVNLVGLLVCVLARDAVVLGIGAFVGGLAAATIQIARQTLVTVMVPATHRGRVLSTLAGANRLGLLLGPFLATAVIAASGAVRVVFLAAAVLVTLGAVALQWLPDPDAQENGRPPTSDDARASLVETVRANRTVLMRLGPVIMVVAAMRQGRNALIPLWGVWIGADAGQIALVVGVAAALDFALFYPGGLLLDRRGRAQVAVASLSIFASGWAVLAGTGFAGVSSMRWLLLAALVVAFANGISSGLIATMGADVADRSRPATFLSVWQLTSNVGGIAAPLLVAGVAAVASIAAAALCLSVLGAVGVALAATFVPRYASRR